jgi:hypothetical protein
MTADAPFRILITGSRTWTDENAIRDAMNEAARGNKAGAITVVHGACPRGADSIADRIATRAGAKVERHPADWDTFGRSAGFKRNTKMVDLGADVCLAFIRAGSRGATHTANLAEKAGIETRRYLA